MTWQRDKPGLSPSPAVTRCRTLTPSRLGFPEVSSEALPLALCSQDAVREHGQRHFVESQRATRARGSDREPTGSRRSRLEGEATEAQVETEVTEPPEQPQGS